MRISLIVRAGIVATVVALAMSTVHAKEGKNPGDAWTMSDASHVLTQSRAFTTPQFRGGSV